jgi:replicative DNA helicase
MMYQGDSAIGQGVSRIPPHNLEAEIAVLSSCTIAKEAIDQARAILEPAMFYKQAHALLFKVFLRMDDAGIPVDLVTVTSNLTATELESIGGIAFFVGLMTSGESTSIFVEYYAEIVREKAALRDIISTSSKALQKAYDAEERAEDIAVAVSQKLINISVAHTSSNVEHVADVADEVLFDIENGISGMGLRTGFSDLDEMILGFHPGELIVLAGAPGGGKTALGMAIARNVAKSAPVAVFSLEMPTKQLVQRILSDMASVPMQDIRRGTLNPLQRSRLADASGKLQNSQLLFNDLSSLSADEIAGKIRILVRENGAQLAVIDYLQLISGRGDNREQEVARISKVLKATARDLSIPILVLAQINKDNLKRADNRPFLGCVRESAAIEQNADLVNFIHRPEYYDPHDRPGEAELIIAKQRNGPVGIVRLSFNSQFVRFGNLENV